jgi:hypothetical protein
MHRAITYKSISCSGLKAFLIAIFFALSGCDDDSRGTQQANPTRVAEGVPVPRPPDPVSQTTDPLVVTYSVLRHSRTEKIEVGVYNCIFSLSANFQKLSTGQEVRYLGSPNTSVYYYHNSSIPEFLAPNAGESPGDSKRRADTEVKKECAIGDGLSLVVSPEKGAAASATIKILFDVVNSNDKKLTIADAYDPKITVTMEIPPLLQDPVVWYALCASQVFKQSNLKTLRDRIINPSVNATSASPQTTLEDK